MFKEVKAMIPNEISGDGYDQQIAYWIEAAVLDLTTSAGIVIPGSVAISWDETNERVVDNSDVTDKRIIGAIALYVCMNIGNPPNYENLLRAYESQKGSMRQNGNYTAFTVTTA